MSFVKFERVPSLSEMIADVIDCSF